MVGTWSFRCGYCGDLSFWGLVFVPGTVGIFCPFSAHALELLSCHLPHPCLWGGQQFEPPFLHKILYNYITLRSLSKYFYTLDSAYNIFPWLLPFSILSCMQWNVFYFCCSSSRQIFRYSFRALSADVMLGMAPLSHKLYLTPLCH